MSGSAAIGAGPAGGTNGCRVVGKRPVQGTAGPHTPGCGKSAAGVCTPGTGSDIDRIMSDAHSRQHGDCQRRHPRDGGPQNPRAWLVSTGRFKAIDRIRRRSRFDVSLEEVAELIEAIPAPEIASEHSHVEDDRLRLIFTCCHPALAPDAQVALTLREVCGLTTEEIARAHLSMPATVAQRIVRAKAKIRDARVPYEVPGRSELAERLDGVLRVIYLVFNEGYLASSGESLIRQSLTTEAIRLGRLLVELLPEPEAVGLLALMLF